MCLQTSIYLSLYQFVNKMHPFLIYNIKVEHISQYWHVWAHIKLSTKIDCFSVSLHSSEVNFGIQFGFLNISFDIYSTVLDKQILTICTSKHLNSHSNSALGVPLQRDEAQKSCFDRRLESIVHNTVCVCISYKSLEEKSKKEISASGEYLFHFVP